MEIILKEKIKNLGNIGDVVKVKKGFAKNFLIPNNRALYSTPQNIELLNQQKAKLEEENNQKLKIANDVFTNLNNKPFVFIRNASESGALYGSVTAKDIVDNLGKGNIIVSSHQVQIKESIKNIGTYNVSVELHSDVIANIIIVTARTKEDAEVMFKAHFDKLNKLAASNDSNSEESKANTKTTKEE